MSVSAGRRILTQFCGSHLKKLTTRTVVRLNSTVTEDKIKDCSKGTIPASEANKVSAVVLNKFSDSLSIENIDPPKTLQANEVLIDVNYCAFNVSDALLAKNLHTFEPSLPMILGYELVGKLIKVGEKAQDSGYKIGDKVIALNKERYGGLCERCVAEVGDIWKIPSSIKSLDAASLFDSYVTALVALERKVNIQEDDMVLINVGMSSIGLAAIDLATNVFRAKVIAVCATEDGAALAREKGVFTSLKYKDRKLLKQISEIAAERNIKAIFDDADGEYLKKVLSCFTDIYKDDATLKDLLRDDNFAVVLHHLSREGRVVIAGTAMTTMQIQSEVQKGAFSVTGFNLAEYRKKKPEAYRQAGDEVLQFFEEGLITPTISLIVGLNKVNDALQFVLDRKSAGKVVVDIKNKEAAGEEVKK